MAGSTGGSNSNLSVLLQSQRVACAASQPLESFFLPGSSPSFLGSRSMMSFEDVHQANGSTRSFFRAFDHEDNGDDDLDEYFHQPEKKRRLTVDQVQFLEKSFELENKLEPERKTQLAKDLGLQPRQIAIWFQNRRARWKTKQLEKDYDVLQSSYNSLKADYDNLHKENEKLKAEVNLLTDKVLLKEKGSSELSDKDALSQEPPNKAVLAADSASEGEVSKISAVACSKQDEISSAKSDIFDSDSPHYAADGVHSSYVFEPDQSDLSQDEEDNFSKSLLPPYVFPKLEDGDYSDPHASFEDHAFWSWPY
ncbi:LEUCINE ZIPPER HOMEOBOX-ASSOCIATED HOMEODOMAIN-LIKE DNA REPAIR PROTEIN XRCC4-RELATED [Salix viminalis]|uniref:Homeobox-leucine zipper protein n=1 Tax=Salix viminalis TaxID=40686 RepID=A0A9Q0NVP7_SALVM|nr:LEUCINE ZIPPER HOMEOBOX-ASSOCIATED HOMEODOMAIN-LIKE DNA REPAIR PROTEIN XRCC4-RELATED [Salix viminalis]